MKVTQHLRLRVAWHDSNHFQWSISSNLSGSMSSKEVIHVEKTEMRKHGSKTIGLNLQ